MSALLIIWVVLVAVLILVVSPRPGTGGPLTFAYFLSLSLIHVPGALSYVAGASPDAGLEPTTVGFQFTLIGAAAFIAGTAIVRRHRIPLEQIRNARSGQLVSKAGTRLLLIGAFSFLFLQFFGVIIPSLTAVISTLSLLLIIGLWLRLYASVTLGHRRGLLLTLAILPFLPIVTLTTGGFVGYGVSWVIAIVALYFVLSRRRFFFIAAMPVVFFLGLSFFVTYAGQRNDIRDVVWSSRASVTERVDSVLSMVTSFRPIDLTSDIDARHLRNRLNQNLLVGVGAIRYRNGQVDLAYGETFQPWLLIPRALWPGKPAVAGSGTIVTNFTGINFAAGTSVGAGQVLEFYYNFGMLGLVVGFFGLGYLIRLLDRRLMAGFARGDLRLILLNGMPGLAMLQPGGSVIETAVAAIAALVAAHGFLFYETKRAEKRDRQIAARSGMIDRPAPRRA